MTLTTAVELPDALRVSGLLAAARPLPAGWEQGIQFNGSTCLAPSPWPYCLDEAVSPPEAKVAGTRSAVAAFEPTGIFQAVECTTNSRDQAPADAIEALAATADYQLGLELASGVTTGNPSLADGTSSNAASVVDALAAGEQAAAAGLYGRLAFFHVSPGMLAELVAAQVVYRDGRTWRTPMGHVVVSSPGYVDLTGIHVTAEVYAEVSVPTTSMDIDRSINQIVAYAEQIGLAAFDPCFNIAVEVTS